MKAKSTEALFAAIDEALDQERILLEGVKSLDEVGAEVLTIADGTLSAWKLKVEEKREERSSQVAPPTPEEIREKLRDSTDQILEQTGIVVDGLPIALPAAS